MNHEKSCHSTRNPPIEPLRSVRATVVPTRKCADVIDEMDWSFDDTNSWQRPAGASSPEIAANSSPPGTPASPKNPIESPERLPTPSSASPQKKPIFSSYSSEVFATAVVDRKLTVSQIDEILALRRDSLFDFKDVEFKTAKAMYDAIDGANDTEVKCAV